MANNRTAGARAFARLTACTFLALAPLAHADDDPAPFVEYSAGPRYSVIAAEAAGWQMQDDCDWHSYLECQLTTVTTTEIGYAFRYTYVRPRPGGGVDRLEREGAGTGAYSCPAGFAIYAVAFGMPVGPYPNREMDLGGPFPLICRASRPFSVSQVAPTAAPVIEDHFSDGHLVQRQVVLSGVPATWSSVRLGDRDLVEGWGDGWRDQFTLSEGRVVALAGGVTFEYGADAGLVSVAALDGERVGRATTYDKEGPLAARLHGVRARLPTAPGPAPIDALLRLGESIDALLGDRVDPHARPD